MYPAYYLLRSYHVLGTYTRVQKHVVLALMKLMVQQGSHLCIYQAPTQMLTHARVGAPAWPLLVLLPQPARTSICLSPACVPS